MKSKKNILPLLILLILLSFCCKQKQQSIVTKTSNSNYIGDSTLSNKNYFKSLVSLDEEKIGFKLKKQNEKYLKEYLNTNNDGEIKSISQNKYSIKLVKETQSDKDNIKVNFYTIIDNKKVDSIQFYRNISGNNFGKYVCLSYFNSMTNKIWQIRYFPLNPLRGNSVGIVSYTEKSVNSEGIIETDKIHYLDESLDVEMVNSNLYY